MGIIDFFIAAKLRTNFRTHLSARLLVALTFVLHIAAVLFTTLFWIIGQPRIAANIAGAAVAIWVIPICLKFFGSTLFATHWLGLVLSAEMIAIGSCFGGTDMATLMWFAVPPLAATFVHGRRAGLFWLVLASVQILLIYAVKFHYPEFYEPTLARPVIIEVLGAVFLIAVLCAFSIFHDYLNEHAREALESANVALERARLTAEAANRSKSGFLANMSHELRTPLNGVIGMAELLKGSTLDPKLREYTEIIGESGDALLHIINDILDFSRIEAGKLALEAVAFDFESLIQKTVRPFKHRAAANQVELHCRIDSEVPQDLFGDPARLRQVVSNLLGNAVKFTSHGKIQLSVRVAGRPSPDESILAITVQDTGIGIAADRIPTLFTPFVQADASTTRKFGGSGLGLAISKEIVTAMGGELAVISIEGTGSCFEARISFRHAAAAVTESFEPRSHSARAPTRPMSAEEKPRRWPRILLVEDNPTNQLVATKFLSRYGYACDVVDNGRSALVALDAHVYDLVFMDCHMPEMDGLEATRLIRARESGGEHLSIIAMTASSLPDDREQCRIAGMDDFLPKPLTLDALGKVLNRFFESPTRASDTAFLCRESKKRVVTAGEDRGRVDSPLR